MRYPLPASALALTLLASACAAAPDGEPAQSVHTALEGRACSTYPIALTPPASAEADVRAAFEKLSPGAVVQFAAPRGTASFVSNLHVSLGTCARGRDADAKARLVIDGAAEAFRIDSSEWTTTYAPTCDAIPAEGTMVYWTRASFGGAPMRKDVFAYRLRRGGLSVWIELATGFYLPPASAALEEDMAGCAPIDAAAAEGSVRTTSLPFQTFQYCWPTGDGKYTPEARDGFTLGADYWEWNEEPTGVRLQRVREGSLKVDPANHTPALIESNANCSWRGVNNIGFGLRFDSVSSKLQESRPGIDCVVCAH